MFLAFVYMPNCQCFSYKAFLYVKRNNNVEEPILLQAVMQLSL